MFHEKEEDVVEEVPLDDDDDHEVHHKTTMFLYELFTVSENICSSGLPTTS